MKHIFFSLTFLLFKLTLNSQTFTYQTGAILLDDAQYQKYSVVNVNIVDNIAQANTANLSEHSIGGKRLDTPPVEHQGTESSCTAFAVGYCVASYYEHRFRNLPYTKEGALRSPEYLYNMTKYSSCNGGAITTNVLDFVRDNGLCSWSDVPYSSDNGCDSPRNQCSTSQEVGGLGGWKRVSKSSNEVKDLIDKGYPVVMCFAANPQMQQMLNTSPYIINTNFITPNDKNYGHCVVIVGYTNYYGLDCFIVQNSWGTGVSDNGIFYISFNKFPEIARELYFPIPNFPVKIIIRNAGYGEAIKVKFNSTEYTLQNVNDILPVTQYFNNELYIQEYVNGSWRWDGPYNLRHGKNYKINPTPNKPKGDYEIVYD